MKIYCVIGLLSFAGIAQAGDFLGFSDDSVIGNVGFFGMNQACTATYGATSKLCSTKDFILSPSLSAQSGEAWINTTPIDSAIDYSGHTISFIGGNCSGWSSNSANGFILDGTTLSLTESIGGCGASRHVACCRATGAYVIAPN